MREHRMPWLWPAAFLGLALAYIASEPLRPYPLHYLVKALPIFMLMAHAGTALTGRLRNLTLAALLFSAGGDVMLSLSFPHQFVAGLSSFLVAQITYTAIFLRFRSPDRPRVKGILSIGIVCYGGLMAGLILPEDQIMRIAVICYVIVISAMAISAVWAWRVSLHHVLGAFLFVVSDSLIAWTAFRDPLPFASLVVMSTYYAAQFMLISGIVLHSDCSNVDSAHSAQDAGR